MYFLLFPSSCIKLYIPKKDSHNVFRRIFSLCESPVTHTTILDTKFALCESPLSYFFLLTFIFLFAIIIFPPALPHMQQFVAQNF